MGPPLMSPSDFISSEPATNTTTPQTEPQEGSPEPQGIVFDLDQATNLGLTSANPGDTYNVKVRVTENDQDGIKCDPISAELAPDDQEGMGDPDASQEGGENPMMPAGPTPRPKPTVRSPKDFGFAKKTFEL